MIYGESWFDGVGGELNVTGNINAQAHSFVFSSSIGATHHITENKEKIYIKHAQPHSSAIRLPLNSFILIQVVKTPKTYIHSLNPSGGYY